MAKHGSNTIDNIQESVVVSTGTDPEKPPPRLIQDMINYRRLLKGNLEFVEKFLRNHGVKV
jgi:hypothetical protein